MCVLIALTFFLVDIFSMHWSTCYSRACVSTPDGRGHSWPPSAVGKVYREFVDDHGTCHAFLYASYTRVNLTEIWHKLNTDHKRE